MLARARYTFTIELDLPVGSYNVNTNIALIQKDALHKISYLTFLLKEGGTEPKPVRVKSTVLAYVQFEKDELQEEANGWC